jgi:tetratricopeptide (TPR) repeat protein
MKIKTSELLVLLLLTAGFTVQAQTFTMGSKCRDLLAAAQEELHQQSFEAALAAYDEFSEGCNTKDAKILGTVGKAEAYNGMGEYDKAIALCDEALDRSKGRNLVAHFQKAYAFNKLGQPDAAKEELEQVIELTEMNQNTAERASNYALMAALYDRQLGDRDSAFLYLDKAMEIDPSNADFLIQKGDMYVQSDEYDKAFDAYDEAVAMGRTDMDMYIIRSQAGLKMLEHKYGTTKAQDLRGMMTEEEKALVCGDLRKALDMGWNDMNKDMFAALVCK